jgi:hypothetical protein
MPAQSLTLGARASKRLRKKKRGKGKGIKKIEKHALDFAQAWAEATAKVQADCFTFKSGPGATASGCAWSKASAKAFASAFADSIASASAEAVSKHCKCQNANTFVFGDAKIVEDIIADVNVKAEAAACAEGNVYAEASAYVNCYADIFAQLYSYVRTIRIYCSHPAVHDGRCGAFQN